MAQVIALRRWGRLNSTVITGPSRVTTMSFRAGVSVAPGTVSVATALASLPENRLRVNLTSRLNLDA